MVIVEARAPGSAINVMTDWASILCYHISPHGLSVFKWLLGVHQEARMLVPLTMCWRHWYQSPPTTAFHTRVRGQLFLHYSTISQIAWSYPMNRPSLFQEEGWAWLPLEDQPLMWTVIRFPRAQTSRARNYRGAKWPQLRYLSWDRQIPCSVGTKSLWVTWQYRGLYENQVLEWQLRRENGS